MKKITFLLTVLISGFSFSQTFTDNFDSYIAGQKLAQQSGGEWTTWSNAPGGAEDALVSNANAASGSNSVYFSSNVDGGGPVDQVRNFGVLNTGQFSLEMNLFVETGKAAYFNLQKTATIGQTWALNANFNDNGSLTIDDAITTNLTTSFPHNVWFNFRLDINFNTNVWEVFVDDISTGSFANGVNQIASIDIFPVDQNTPFASGFYVDDFQYTVTPYTLPNVNGAVTFVSIDGPNLAGSEVTRKVKIRNLGVTTITSFDIMSTYNGIDYTQNFTGQNLASLAEMEVTLTTPITLIAGSNPLLVSITNVNGAGANDGDLGDNSITKILTPIVPALGKMVVGEEGTGTWCQWCPRGAVFMDLMENKYENYWAGIAVHNGDPMVVTHYDSVMGTKIGGYPSSLVDRGFEDDPSNMEGHFLTRIALAPTAYITNIATWDSVTKILSVTVSANFQTSANNNFKLACVLTEDNVTGGAGYAQSNAYAGGGNGVMGGYELLPSPVPANQMVYDHVARAILPNFNGMDNSFPATVNSGEMHSQTFNFVIEDTWKLDDMHIIGMLLAPNGNVDNAGKATIAEATEIGVGIKEAKLTNEILVYPNPTSKELNIFFENGNVTQINIIANDGKIVTSRKVTSNYLGMDVSMLKSGMYIVELVGADFKVNKLFIKE